MKYGSVCSGIEAASLAWQPLVEMRWVGERIQSVEENNND